MQARCGRDLGLGWSQTEYLMDPLTQSALGSALAQSVADKRRLRAFAIAGAIGGAAPDLDILISSATDPLLYLEYHRQFTHSLLFIPLGAAICALCSFGFLRKRLTWQETFIACLLGYATHGLLDACTSYGTQLFWPFSDARISWNWVSVVDPAFTLPLLGCLGLSLVRRERGWALAGLMWAALYISFGLLQHQRAEAAARAQAEIRGHTVVRMTVKPGFGNLLLWKVIYEHDGRYSVDAVRAGIDLSICEGDEISALDPDTDLPWLQEGSQQSRDVERFRWFSNGWLALDPEEPAYVVDVRYSALPNRIDALWGLRLDPQAEAGTHAEYHVLGGRRTESLPELLGLLRGEGCRPLE